MSLLTIAEIAFAVLALGTLAQIATALKEISIATRQQAAAYILAGNLGDDARAALTTELRKQGHHIADLPGSPSEEY